MLKKRLSLITAVAVAGLLAATNSFAALDLTGISADLTDVNAVMGIVIVGLFAMWGFRKVIKTTNRS